MWEEKILLMMARDRMTRHLVWVSLWLLYLCSVSTAQTVKAENATSDIPQIDTARYQLDGLEMVPWSNNLQQPNPSAFRRFQLSGNLVVTTPNNVASLTSNDIAFISCDQEDYAAGNLNATATYNLATIQNPPPVAIVLYTITSRFCRYISGDSNDFNATFTTLDSMSQAAEIARTNSSIPAMIIPDLNSLASANRPNTTSDAMIILYAITGLITAMFVVIILTGAIRAHRHPERYGPRNVAGRPRQSRAKGVARAMLETIPIIKFGDPDPLPAKPTEDVELGSQTAAASPERSQTGQPATEGAHDAASHENTSSEQVNTDGNTIASTQPRPDGTNEKGMLGCSICIEDFEKGEEVRVLPCNHKFHPHCVDPWLLNVSGICPLCRVSLDPDGKNRPSEPQSSEESRPTSHVATDVSGSRRPGSGLLTDRLRVRMMAQLPAEERLAAARRMRSEGSSQSNRHSMTDRVRDRFRLRTRRHGEDTSTSAAESNENATASGAL